MIYVLDASVALKWVFPEPHADKARQLRTDYQNRIHALLVPDIFAGEVAHVLTKAERQRIIAVGQSAPLLANIFKTAPAQHVYMPLLSRAIDISSHTRSGVFDCLYVALAEREQCELVTADDKLVWNLQAQSPFIVPLSSFP